MKTAIDICHKWIGFWQPRVGYNAPPNIISAMEEYAKIYHESEVNKLSKADVIKSVCECTEEPCWGVGGKCVTCGLNVKQN